MKIYAPVKGTNGVYASVRFINGVGETDKPHLIEWFKTHGYTLESCENHSENSVEKCENILEIIETVNEEVETKGYSTKKTNFEDMTPNELRDWAKSNGLGGVIKNTRNKEKLLELIRGCADGC